MERYGRCFFFSWLTCCTEESVPEPVPVQPVSVPPVSVVPAVAPSQKDDDSSSSWLDSAQHGKQGPLRTTTTTRKSMLEIMHPIYLGKLMATSALVTPKYRYFGSPQLGFWVVFFHTCIIYDPPEV